MKYLRTVDPRFHLLDLKVGIFLLTSLLGTLVVLGYIGWRSEVFTPVVAFSIKPESSQAIVRGTTVKYRGFRVGKVSNVTLDSTGRVEVQIRIFKKYAELIREDTVARLRPETMIGDEVIDVSNGSEKSPPAAHGSTLAFEREATLSEMTERLRAEITPAVGDIRELLAYLNDPQGDIRSLMRNLQTVSADLSKEMPATLAAVRESATHSHQFFDYINSPENELKSTLTELHETMVHIQNTMPSILKKAEDAAGHVERMTAVLRRAAEKAAPKIPVLVDKAADAAEGATEVTDTLKGLWPISPQLKKKREEPLTVHGVR